MCGYYVLGVGVVVTQKVGYGDAKDNFIDVVANEGEFMSHRCSVCLATEYYCICRNNDDTLYIEVPYYDADRLRI